MLFSGVAILEFCLHKFDGMIVPTIGHLLRNLPLFRSIYFVAIQAEAWMFDHKHNVDTRDRRIDRQGSQGDLSQGFWYLPTRAKRAKITLRKLPIDHYERYVFADIGSGKGRVLLLAAELPFAQVLGIEMRADLHEQACNNIRRCRGFKKACMRIESLNTNALHFEFPEQDLVLYLFNPFGRDITKAFFSRLATSIRQNPRDVIVIMFHPEFAAELEELPCFQLIDEEPNCRVYRTRSSSAL